MALDDQREERLIYLGCVIAALVALAWLFGFLVWDSGQVAGLLVNGAWPHSTPGDVWGILVRFFTNLGDPAASWPPKARAQVGPVVLLYVFLIVQLAALGFLGWFAVRGVTRFRRRRKGRRMRLGFASAGEVQKMLSAAAVRKKASSVRPMAAQAGKVDPKQVGFELGKDIRSGKRVYASVEDVFLIVAPPRQGKDVHFCIPYTIDAPGPVLMTSTRADAFSTTVRMRERMGTVKVFDPNDMTNWHDRLRWSPIRGCENPLTALSRASAFVAGAGVGEGVTNASYWTGVATSILRCYLHAAALGGKTMADVVQWSTQPTNPEPINLLRVGEQQDVAARGWAGELEQASSGDAESRGNMWNGVRRALDCFADPGVLDSCSPAPDEVFDVDEFLAGRNTLYVLGKEKKSGSVAPLVTAMMEDLFDQARAKATRMPKSRLDPPLTVELNEAAHIAPMPNLPGYMGDSGGFSIALHVYLQSLAQARSRWSDNEAAVMWDTAAIRIVMGGSGHVSDLEDISKLVGEYDAKQKTVTKGRDGKSVSVSQQPKRVLAVEELRTLEFGKAVVVARSARPVEIRLTPWWKRPDGEQIRAGQSEVDKYLQQMNKAPNRPMIEARQRLQLPAGPSSYGDGGSANPASGGTTAQLPHVQRPALPPAGYGQPAYGQQGYGQSGAHPYPAQTPHPGQPALPAGPAPRPAPAPPPSQPAGGPTPLTARPGGQTPPAANPPGRTPPSPSAQPTPPRDQQQSWGPYADDDS